MQMRADSACRPDPWRLCHGLKMLQLRHRARDLVEAVRRAVFTEPQTPCLNIQIDRSWRAEVQMQVDSFRAAG